MAGHRDMMNGYIGIHQIHIDSYFISIFYIIPIFCEYAVQSTILQIIYNLIRDEMKCQPHLTQAKGGRESQGVQGTLDNLEPICEDDEDPDNVYAVYRGRLIHQSFHLVDIVNEFGKCGGFQAIIQRLSNHKPNIPVKNLRFIISPLSKV